MPVPTTTLTGALATYLLYYSGLQQPNVDSVALAAQEVPVIPLLLGVTANGSAQAMMFAAVMLLELLMIAPLIYYCSARHRRAPPPLLTSREVTFDQVDADGDGVISPAEFEAAQARARDEEPTDTHCWGGASSSNGWLQTLSSDLGVASASCASDDGNPQEPQNPNPNPVPSDSPQVRPADTSWNEEMIDASLETWSLQADDSDIASLRRHRRRRQRALNTFEVSDPLETLMGTWSALTWVLREMVGPPIEIPSDSDSEVSSISPRASLNTSFVEEVDQSIVSFNSAENWLSSARRRSTRRSLQASMGPAVLLDRRVASKFKTTHRGKLWRRLSDGDSDVDVVVEEGEARFRGRLRPRSQSLTSIRR